MAETALDRTEDAARAALPAVDSVAVFQFTHKVFSLPGARIAMDIGSKQPTFYAALGELQVALSLDVLGREFEVKPGTPDGELLALAGKGLRFVKEIRPNDSIPRELLDGTASWAVEERHRAIAKAKLIASVGACITKGADASFSLARFMTPNDDPAGREEVQAALGEMAELLGLGSNGNKEVLDRIERCARELCYIEALWDVAAQLRVIDSKLARLMRSYQRDRAAIEELERVRGLMRKPIGEFADRFLQVEAQTGEIVVLLRNVPRQIEFIRAARDDIHHRLMDWTGLIEGWKELPIECGRAAERAIRSLYQFLARVYAPKIDWR